jgi:hypothetical protein
MNQFYSLFPRNLQKYKAIHHQVSFANKSVIRHHEKYVNDIKLTVVLASDAAIVGAVAFSLFYLTLQH